MRLRSTLVLLVVLLGLGGYVYWVELPQAEQDAKKKTLFEFKADDVTAVSLTYQDREIALSKTGDEWRLTKPMDVLADAVTAKNLVTAIADCEIKKDLADAATDLAQYGLDKPFVTVRVKLKDKELPAIAVGKNTPVGFNTYIQRLDDKKVMLANSAFRTGMEKQVNDLRDKTILSFDDASVTGIELRGVDNEIVLGRGGEGWQIERPDKFAADATTVRAFLSTLRSMRAVDFANDNPTDLSNYGLDKPRLKISLLLGKDKAPKQVLIGGDNPEKKTEFYVQVAGTPTVFTVSDWVWRDLNKGVSDFRDKTVLAFDRANLTGVDLQRNDGGSVKLTGSDKDGWQLAGVEGKPAKTTINQWIGDIHELKGYEIAADAPAALADYGLDKPLLTVVLTASSGPLGTVLIGEHKTEQGTREYFAKSASAATVFKVRDYIITRLNKQAKDFLETPTPTPGGPTAAAAPQIPGLEQLAPADEGMEMGGDEQGEE